MQTPLGIFILIVVAITAGASIFVSSQADAYPNDYVAPVSSAEYEHAIVAIGGTIVTAEIVDTKEKLELGLSGREGLSFNKGMLFVFPKTGYHSFWMKDMSFPIDIIWLSKEKRVVSIAEKVSPDTYPKDFTPQSPALYVLETPSGFVSAHAISIGTPASW